MTTLNQALNLKIIHMSKATTYKTKRHVKGKKITLLMQLMPTYMPKMRKVNCRKCSKRMDM